MAPYKALFAETFRLRARSASLVQGPASLPSLPPTCHYRKLWPRERNLKIHGFNYKFCEDFYVWKTNIMYVYILFSFLLFIISQCENNNVFFTWRFVFGCKRLLPQITNRCCDAKWCEIFPESEECSINTLFRRRSWANISGEQGRARRGSSARSAAAGRRTPYAERARNERTTRTPAHTIIKANCRNRRYRPAP